MLLAIGTVSYHRRYTPPDCTDPRTLALVERSLVDQYHLPTSTRLELIHTIAGGYIAFQFVCSAFPAGFTRDQLPPGTAVPAGVDYVSRLTPDGTQHVVSVRVTPRMILEPVD